MQMYQEGLAKERGELTGGGDAGVEKGQGGGGGGGGGGGMTEAEMKDEIYDALEAEDVEAEGIEDLLAWSSELDYDSYVANWHVLATSGTSGSDFHIDINAARGRPGDPHRVVGAQYASKSTLGRSGGSQTTSSGPYSALGTSGKRRSGRRRPTLRAPPPAQPTAQPTAPPSLFHHHTPPRP